MKEDNKEISEEEFNLSAKYTRRPYDIALEHAEKEI